MGQHVRRESYPCVTSSRIDYLGHQASRRHDLMVAEVDDLSWPFERVTNLDDEEVRETAYEIFFTSCRSSPGFGGRHALTFQSNHENNGGNGDGGSKLNQVVTKPASRVKKVLGLKMLKRSPSRRMMSGSSGVSSTPSSPVAGADTGKNSDTMRTLCNSVVSLSWRSANGTPTDVCHWADGFPFNIHLYTKLLQSIFDIRDETLVLDEVDELLELMKKTWSTLGIALPIHNVCFTWVLFHQYIVTGQVEPDLLCGSHAMLNEVANDAKREKDSLYVKILSSVLSSMQGWAEKRLLNYHEFFQRGNANQIENLLPVMLSASKILGEDLTITDGEGEEKGDITIVDSSGDRVDKCIRSSMKNAFEKRAAKLEKVIVQIVVEDSTECDDGGKTVVREMVPFDIDSVILSLLGKWIDESLHKGKECVKRAKETETWNPKSKSEPFAQSAAELMKLAATTVEEFFQVPIAITESLVQDLADGLENLFQDYMMFVAACGSKQNYIPLLPPLTRCSRDSKFMKLWKRVAPCSSGFEEQHSTKRIHEDHHHLPKPSTDRGTQRLYVRLNTLHYLITHIHSIDKALSLNPGVVSSNHLRFANNRRAQSNNSPLYFESANLSILAACQHVSEVAAYRLVFHDSSSVFYDSLYVGGVARGHIKPVLRILSQNISQLTTILIDRAQPLALKEIMKASFDSFLMVLLAGGSSRVFFRSDHEIIQEDFEHLRILFSNCVESLIADNVVQGEAAVVEGVIGLMGQNTEQLMEDFSIVTCEGSGMGILGNGQNLPMPPTTGKWNRSDPNTILRVLCYRNDRAANQFLKKTFQLAKRR
ncbi:unnamed protein product [Lupinus luteus]|uniref:Protein unc-13 homolog n=1 Tax=Lupinus luteus TaxID=3873 RepID=A0AAV1XHT6_LUPLU